MRLTMRGYRNSTPTMKNRSRVGRRVPFLTRATPALP